MPSARTPLSYCTYEKWDKYHFIDVNDKYYPVVVLLDTILDSTTYLLMIINSQYYDYVNTTMSRDKSGLIGDHIICIICMQFDVCTWLFQSVPQISVKNSLPEPDHQRIHLHHGGTTGFSNSAYLRHVLYTRWHTSSPHMSTASHPLTSHSNGSGLTAPSPHHSKT